jgi:hypothetical protein
MVTRSVRNTLDTVAGWFAHKRTAGILLEVPRSEGLPIVVRCPFVRAYLHKHPIVADR